MKKHTKMYKTAIATTLATSALVAVVPAQADTVTFKDVDSSNQFYDYITNLANRGIISGYGDDTFRPGLDVRRDHAAKIIAGVLGLNTKNVVDPKFTDVPANHPHYGEIAAIKEAGIISGDGYGNYLPEKALTRGEMAKIIANAFELEVPAGSTTPLTDIKGNMFEQYITALYVNGVTKGTGDNTFKPSDIVTREQLAAFVVRAEEIAGEVVDKAVKVESIDGDTIVVNGEVLVLTEELKAVFNENNAAALKNAKVELVVRYKDAEVASLAPVANNRQGEVVGINAVELPNAKTKFNASGFVIPTVTVTAEGVTVSNVAVSTFTVAKGATVTLENVVADSVTVQGTLTLAEKTVVTELKVTGTAKITVKEGVKLEKVTLEQGKTLKDVIANYDEVKEQLKEVKVEEVKPGNTGSTGGSTGGSAGGGAGGGAGSGSDGSTDDKTGGDVTTVTDTANVLVQNLVAQLSSYYGTVGTFNSNTFVFDFKDTLTTMQEVKVEIEKSADNTKLENALLNSISVAPAHFANLLKIEKVTVDNVEIITNPFIGNQNITLTEAKNHIKAQLTEESVATVLDKITGLNHDEAKVTNLDTYLGEEGKKFDIKVTFTSNDTPYSKTVTLVK